MTSACGTKEYNLSSQTNNLSYSEEGAQDNIVINGSDGNCELEHSPDWLTAIVSDSVVNLKVAPNVSGALRADSLVIKCGKSCISIPVSQYAKATKLELPDGKNIKIPREGGTIELAALSDGLIKVEAFDAVEAEWYDGVLKVSSPKNDGKRIKGNLKLIAGDITKDVSVIVEGDVCTTCDGTGYIKCKVCKGKGEIWKWDPYEGYYGCKACGGRGYMYRWVYSDDWESGKGKSVCPTCKGIG